VAQIRRGGVAQIRRGGVAQIRRGGVAQIRRGGVAQQKNRRGGVAQIRRGGVAQIRRVGWRKSVSRFIRVIRDKATRIIGIIRILLFWVMRVVSGIRIIRIIPAVGLLER
jgi:hypothetical protein